MNIRFDASVGSIVMGVVAGLLLAVGLPVLLTDQLGMSNVIATAVGMVLGFLAVLAGAAGAIYGSRRSP